ncbi:hypothetical protein [Paracoccus sp. ME4]|uniref:hypothetical protein n=1 Tax=Paracoccus sp. ME4 TaxID=3138066 RepID=UPI00398B97B0
MSFIALRNQRRAFLNGVEQTSLFINGQRIWQKPVVLPAISEIYGTGAGEVLIHTATWSGTSIPNAGGGGATYNATMTGATIDAEPEWLQFAATGRFFEMASIVEGIGKRFYMPIDLSVSRNLIALMGYRLNQTDSQVSLIFNETGLRVGGKIANTNVSFNLSNAMTVTQGLHLLELQLNLGAFEVFLDGVSVGTASHDFTTFPLKWFGAGVTKASDLNSFLGRMGRIVVQATDGTHSTNIAAVRQYYRATYPGLTIAGGGGVTPEPDIPLAQYFGTGSGQILVDVPTDTLNNIAAGGTSFNLTSTGVVEDAAPGWRLWSAAGQRLQFASSLDLNGKRIFLPIDADVTRTLVSVLGGAVSSNAVYASLLFDGTGLRIARNAGSWVVTDIAGLNSTLGVHLLEIQVSGDRIGCWLDGRFVGWGLPGQAQFLVQFLGVSNSGAGDTSNGFVGRMGRPRVLVTDGSHTAVINAIRDQYEVEYPGLTVAVDAPVTGADNGISALSAAGRGTDVLVDATVAGTRYNQILTVAPAGTGLTRYDTVYLQGGALAVAQGTARTTDPEYGQPALPGGAIPLARVRVGATAINSAVARGPLIGGIHHSVRAIYEAHRTAIRAALPALRGKYAAGQPISLAVTGDSITAVQSAGPSLTLPNTDVRDRFGNYFTGQALQADVQAAITRFTSAQMGRPGSVTDHVKVGWFWPLLNQMATAKGYVLGSNLSYFNFAVATYGVVEMLNPDKTPTAWLSAWIAQNADAHAIATGMNDRTLDPVRVQGDMEIIAGLAQDAGRQVFFVELPRANTTNASNHAMTQRTWAATRAAALASGTGCVPLGLIYEDGLLGGHVVNVEDVCGINKSNHPTPLEQDRNGQLVADCLIGDL